jgi:superfamily II DNA/RNA helicase
MTFEALGLHPQLLNTLAGAGYAQPTPVQSLAIPAALAGRDLIVSSQTGSGKTAAFMLPAIHRFAQSARRSEQPDAGNGRRRFRPARPRMLVLAPTRELALQVTAATEKYGAQFRRIKAAAILGGMPYPKQMQLLARDPEILVATPGRLMDHMRSGRIDCSRVEMLVLDEADRMLDMGFIDDIETIVAATPDTRQTLLFSATVDGRISKMAQKITRDAELIKAGSAAARHENIEQRVHFVDDVSHKGRLLSHLLSDVSIDQAVVFTATKRNADVLSERLNVEGFRTAALHGDMHQGARNRTLDAMRRKRVRVLVATDVAARGIDVPTITHVFNFDLPRSPEDYVHRIGRTGRAGRNGLAVSLVHHSEAGNVKSIERYTRQLIPVKVVAGHEPRKAPSAQPRGASGHKGAKPAAGHAQRRHSERGANARADRAGKDGWRAPRRTAAAR